jgi:hypothetical protein
MNPTHTARAQVDSGPGTTLAVNWWWRSRLADLLAQGPPPPPELLRAEDQPPAAAAARAQMPPTAPRAQMPPTAPRAQIPPTAPCAQDTPAVPPAQASLPDGLAAAPVPRPLALPAASAGPGLRSLFALRQLARAAVDDTADLLLSAIEPAPPELSAALWADGAQPGKPARAGTGGGPTPRALAAALTAALSWQEPGAGSNRNRPTGGLSSNAAAEPQLQRRARPPPSALATGLLVLLQQAPRGSPPEQPPLSGFGSAGPAPGGAHSPARALGLSGCATASLLADVLLPPPARSPRGLPDPDQGADEAAHGSGAGEAAAGGVSPDGARRLAAVLLSLMRSDLEQGRVAVRALLTRAAAVPAVAVLLTRAFEALGSGEVVWEAEERAACSGAAAAAGVTVGKRGLEEHRGNREEAGRAAKWPARGDAGHGRGAESAADGVTAGGEELAASAEDGAGFFGELYGCVEEPEQESGGGGGQPLLARAQKRGRVRRVF